MRQTPSFDADEARRQLLKEAKTALELVVNDRCNLLAVRGAERLALDTREPRNTPRRARAMDTN
jgi:hypothetical protein